VDFLSHPAFWIVIAAASELIAHVAAEIQQLGAALLRALYAAIKPKKRLIGFGKPWLAAVRSSNLKSSAAVVVPKRRYPPS
jgi:hypothetical protein